MQPRRRARLPNLGDFIRSALIAERQIAGRSLSEVKRRFTTDTGFDETKVGLVRKAAVDVPNRTPKPD
jgi:hypothetical protein